MSTTSTDIPTIGHNPRGTPPPTGPVSEFDVLIIGAGISGLNSAYHIQTAFPHLRYTILEARDDLGGTWNLFQYPGIRSDSDLHTFGFKWRPWPEKHAIAEGPEIIKYLKDSARETGIDRHIEYGKKIINADWSTKGKIWTSQVLDVKTNQMRTYKAHFVVLGTGYYNYDKPLDAYIPGIENFAGKVVHPQFWPKDLDYKDKNIVVIGSGATTITLLPALANSGAGHVTQLQRSPSYILTQPTLHPSEDYLHKFLPRSWALSVVRWKYIITSFVFFHVCQIFPGAFKRLLIWASKKQLPEGTEMETDWNPRYNPWEQRMCVTPDADYYVAMRKGRTSIVTGTIEKITEKSIVLTDGRTLTPDTIVTATGLRLCIGGQATISVDGKPLKLNTRHLWKGMCVSTVPNVAFSIGYTNASWTLGAENMGATLVKIFKEMQARDASVMTPVIPEDVKPKLGRVPPFNLSSTYLTRAKEEMPMHGGVGPWRARVNVLVDMWDVWFGDVEEGLVYEKVGRSWLAGAPSNGIANGHMNGKVGNEKAY